MIISYVLYFYMLNTLIYPRSLDTMEQNEELNENEQIFLILMLLMIFRGILNGQLQSLQTLHTKIFTLDTFEAVGFAKRNQHT